MWGWRGGCHLGNVRRGARGGGVRVGAAEVGGPRRDRQTCTHDVARLLIADYLGSGTDNVPATVKIASTLPSLSLAIHTVTPVASFHSV